jgi:hypothetical protein
VRAGICVVLTVATCVPYDPASKGGSESTVKLAKADLVPTAANLLGEYGSFTALEAACAVFCEQVNARPHRVTRRAPAEMLADERARLHPVPAADRGLGGSARVSTTQSRRRSPLGPQAAVSTSAATVGCGGGGRGGWSTGRWSGGARAFPVLHLEYRHDHLSVLQPHRCRCSSWPGLCDRRGSRLGRC